MKKFNFQRFKGYAYLKPICFQKISVKLTKISSLVQGLGLLTSKVYLSFFGVTYYKRLVQKDSNPQPLSS